MAHSDVGVHIANITDQQFAISGDLVPAVLTFSFGRRMSVGQPLASMELVQLLSTLIQRSLKGASCQVDS